MRYSVGGRSANTAATQDHVGASLWNPHATLSIYVKQIAIYQIAATLSNHILYQTSTRGTPGSTVTPGAHCSWGDKKAPVSGALLDLAAFTVQPTLVTSPVGILRAQLPATAGATLIWTFGDLGEYQKEGYLIPPGTGIAVATPVATILQASDFVFIFDEFSDWESEKA